VDERIFEIVELETVSRKERKVILFVECIIKRPRAVDGLAYNALKERLDTRPPKTLKVLSTELHASFTSLPALLDFYLGDVVIS
jgi:hypothetical protein